MIRISTVFSLSLVAVGACGPATPTTATATAPAPDFVASPVPPTTTSSSPGAELAKPPPPPPPLHGVLVDDIDKTADPCTDFFQYANGAWRAAHPIPPSQSRWSRRWESGEVNKQHVSELLAAVAAKPGAAAGSVDQIVGDFYGACMDESRADAAGVAPLAPMLADLDKITTRADVAAAIAAAHAYGFDVAFTAGSRQDAHHPEHVLLDLGAGGLGLPDRDYYLKPDKRFVEARAKYRAHVAKMFELAGRAQSKATVDAVIALETELATVSLDNVALRDPKKQDNPMPAADLAKLAPSFPWADHLRDAFHVAPDATINVDQPAFLKGFDRALAKTPVATWRAYLVWHLLNEAAPYLGKPLVEEKFAFDDAYLAGATEMKPRAVRCAEAADGLFGEAVGQLYVARYFPPEAKARMREMVDNILAATGDAIRDATWMSDATKQRALGKLATFNPKIGYPDTWKDYSHVSVARDTLWADVLAGRAFVTADDRAQIGKPVDRKRWGMTPPTSNAYYNPQLNEIVFPAGILVPPGFDMTASDAVNYGAIGVVIGHEVSHGFDDQGAQYDETGALSNWWTADDLAKFHDRGTCVSDQFDGYFVEPGLHHNGKLVLGESIGDLGGVSIAWRAFQRARAAKAASGTPAATIDGFTPEQQFFLGWGQWRGDETRPEQARLMVQGDPHPVAKFRVDGPLSNFPPFATAFACKDGAAMVRPAAKRCTVW